LIGVAVTSGKDHVMLGTKTGLAIRFDESDVRAMGRPAGGVTGARFKREGDEVIDMVVIPAGENVPGCAVLTGCLLGYGKRTLLEEYPVKGRGTQGVINIETGERNGDVVGMKLVRDTDDVIFMTANGIVMRTGVGEIRQTGRAAAGVRLLKLDEGDKLVSFAVVERDEEEPKPVEGEAPAAPDAPAPDAPAPEAPPTA
jgi:DNA gyrase subunit A